MLIVVMLGWERSLTINSKIIHGSCRFCTLFSMAALIANYIGQVDIVYEEGFPSRLREVFGFGKINDAKVNYNII